MQTVVIKGLPITLLSNEDMAKHIESIYRLMEKEWQCLSDEGHSMSVFRSLFILRAVFPGLFLFVCSPAFLPDFCDNLLNMLQKGEDFMPYYKSHSVVLGKSITFEKNGERFEAVALDIDRDGGLIVKTEAGQQTLTSGEITLRIKK